MSKALEISDGLRIGDAVQNTGSDYRFIGIVVAVFAKKSGAIRVVVENDDGILHIFNPKQLAKREVMQ